MEPEEKDTSTWGDRQGLGVTTSNTETDWKNLWTKTPTKKGQREKSLRHIARRYRATENFEWQVRLGNPLNVERIKTKRGRRKRKKDGIGEEMDSILCGDG